MKRSGTVLALALFAVSALAVAAGPARSDVRIRIAYDLVGIPVPILHGYVAGVLAGHRASAKLYGRPEIVCTPPGASSGGEVHRRAAAPAPRTRRTYAAGRARRPSGAGQDIPLPGRLSFRPWRRFRIGGARRRCWAKLSGDFRLNIPNFWGLYTKVPNPQIGGFRSEAQDDEVACTSSTIYGRGNMLKNNSLVI